MASRPQFSAATVAANGVDFLDPLKPAFPADPQASALPRMSVMVMSRLLNVAEMWAIPSVSTTFLDRLGPGALAGAGAVILLLRHFLLAGNGTREIHASDTCHDQPCRCLCLGLRLQMMRTTP